MTVVNHVVLKKHYKKLEIVLRCKSRNLAVGLLLCLTLGNISSASAKDTSIESATWRFEFDNDVFFNKDNKISSGWSLQKHSAVA